MNNACIVLKKRITIENGGENAVFAAFSAYGYSFDEVRILPQNEEKILREALVSLRKAYDNVLLLADRTVLPLFKDFLSSLAGLSCVNEYAGASIYQGERESVFLLSADATATGAGFVREVCAGYLQQRSGRTFARTVLRAVGANEARVQALLAEGEKRSEGKIRFSHRRRFDEDVIEMLYDDTAPKMTVDGAIRLFVEGLTDSVYALQDVTLEEQLVRLLKLRGRKLSVAESFTGGGVARRITSVSGASEVYFEGLNTYAEESKRKRLGVSQYVLRTTGTVSDQTAYEMALGLLNSGDCDFSIATTGLAGPNTDRSMLPVGLCFIAVGTKEGIYVYRYKFDGDRREITEKAINYALFLAYQLLKKI